MDTTLELPDGRMLGYADYGPPEGTPVIWCHGGPGSRMEPKMVSDAAAPLGLRLIGLDRPGYGLSTPRPGRSIEVCVPDLLALADHLGVDRFATVGVSTGGAYALSTAAIAPDRVIAVVACCALTDMRDEVARAAMTGVSGAISDIWNSSTRDEAIAFATEQFGTDGTKMFNQAASVDGEPAAVGLAEADLAMFADPTFLANMAESLPPMFAWGVEGYADDRLADGPGWAGFDVGVVSCPVVVLHGDSDSICPPVNAHHTAAIVPNATLKLTPGDGHFSVVRHVPEVLADLLAANA